MSLEHPLSHAYLLAGNPEVCADRLTGRLHKLFADRSESLQIDAGVVETLSIEMARDLSQRGRQRARGEARCSVRGFQLATRPAQNALLKTLEEPADGVHFFFVTPTPNHLLETVRSRTTRSDLCGQNHRELESSVENFLQANTLTKRLEIARSVAENKQLVAFIASLAGIVDSERVKLQTALRKVVVWLQESGRSDEQIAEFIAIAASQKENG